MKKVSDVFKSIRFAKMDPKHDKGPATSTDDEEHGAVSSQEFAQQLAHVKKRSMQEEKKDQYDTGEYDQEGDMAKSDLRSIIANAQKMHDMIDDADNLPEWVQSKITKAEDYISTVANYMTSEMSEEVKDEYARKVDKYLKKKYNKEEVEHLEEGRPSQRHPLEGHEYHKKSNAELEYIAKDAHKAAEAMKSHNTDAENKYRDQANDSATVRHFRKTSGTPDWYKKKYGLKEEVVNEVMDEPNYKLSIQARQAAADKSSTALSGLVAKKNLKQTEGKNKSQAFVDKMISKVNAARRLKEEDAYDKVTKPSDKPHDKEAAAKRAKEAALAARKTMAKEEVEQIDEISTKTLAKAASAASDPDADYHYGKSHDPQKFADHAKKTKDAKSAAAVQGAADAKGHYTRPGHSLGSYDKLAHRTTARVTGVGKANKQDVNRLKKSISLNAEEVEQIDELSNDMLGRYKAAAGADASKADKAGDHAKGNKRFSGIVKATKKQFDNDMKKEDASPPFDGPYKKATGTVTDKSGAKHTAYSQVKDLAKKAMQAQAAKMKPVKTVKESLEESRKVEIIKDASKSAKEKASKTKDKFEADPILSSEIVKEDK